MMTLRNILNASMIFCFSFGIGTAGAVDSSGITSDSRDDKSTQWVRVPISVKPMERVVVRDYKGATSDSYVNHPMTSKVLKIRVGQANELYFGPWRFQVDASRLSRFGDIDLSVRMSHVNQSIPNTYTDLGQRILSGKALNNGSTLLFISDSKARFDSDGSRILADVEFGKVDEDLQSALSAAAYAKDLSPKPGTTY